MEYKTAQEVINALGKVSVFRFICMDSERDWYACVDKPKPHNLGGFNIGKVWMRLDNKYFKIDGPENWRESVFEYQEENEQTESILDHFESPTYDLSEFVLVPEMNIEKPNCAGCYFNSTEACPRDLGNPACYEQKSIYVKKEDAEKWQQAESLNLQEDFVLIPANFNALEEPTCEGCYFSEEGNKSKCPYDSIGDTTCKDSECVYIPKPTFDYSGLMLVRVNTEFGTSVCSGCVFENERACPVHVGNFNCSDNNGIYVKKDGIVISVEQ